MRTIVLVFACLCPSAAYAQDADLDLLMSEHLEIGAQSRLATELYLVSSALALAGVGIGAGGLALDGGTSASGILVSIGLGCVMGFVGLVMFIGAIVNDASSSARREGWRRRMRARSGLAAHDLVLRF